MCNSTTSSSFCCTRLWSWRTAGKWYGPIGNMPSWGGPWASSGRPGWVGFSRWDGRKDRWMDGKRGGLQFFFFLSPSHVLPPAARWWPRSSATTPRPLFSCFTRRSCGHCTHTHTQENARLLQAQRCFFFFSFSNCGCVLTQHRHSALPCLERKKKRRAGFNGLRKTRREPQQSDSRASYAGDRGR